VQRAGDVRPGLAAHALALERRRDHPRVVEHEGVAGAQQLGQVADGAVLGLGLGAGPHHEQARRVARAHGMQRDPVFRQLEVEQVGAHGRSFPCGSYHRRRPGGKGGMRG
jgi:hypothetical protein